MDYTFITEKINELRQHFINEKDGGRSFIAALSKELNHYDLNQRKQIIEFFIQELQYDKNGMRGLALPVLEDMEATEAAPFIYETYLYFLKDKDEKWEKEVITTLLKLRYKEPQEFYSYYIDKYFNKNPDNGYIFFLGILYCNVNPIKALDLLSDYFCKHLIVPNKEMVLFFENRMGFLFNYFIKNPVDYIPDLLKQTARKNKEAGLRLKEIMLYYFHSDLVKDYNKEFIQEKINTLNDIII